MIYPRTELEAVNTILRMVGETPVNTTDLADVAPGAQALALLRQISRAVQSRGWYFNRRKDLTLTPAIDGRVPVSVNTVSVIPYQGSTTVLTIRGNALYDVTNETDRFTQPVRVTLIVALDFADLPECFREYVTMEAGVRYTSSYSQSDLQFRFTEDELKQAQVRMLQEDVRNSRYSFMPGFRRTLDA